MNEKRKFSFWVEDDEKLDYNYSKVQKEKVEKENNAKNIIYSFPQNTKYKIEISTSLYFLGKPISENKIESTWQINYNETDNTILIEVLDKKNVKIDSQIKPLLEIVDKINKTTDVLHLQLNGNKTVKNVLKLDDILKKWEKIKFEDLKFHELEDEYFKTIVKAYDNEFRTLTQSLQMNILYHIFFYPQGNIKYPLQDYRNIGESKKTISQLFPQQHIYYDLWYKSAVEDGKIQIFCSSQNPKNWDKQKLENEYHNNYAKLLLEPFHFKFSLESRYIHNVNGILENGKTYIKEQANEKLFYIGEYNITLLNNETNELNTEL